jgi:hypothetical protein
MELDVSEEQWTAQKASSTKVQLARKYAWKDRRCKLLAATKLTGFLASSRQPPVLLGTPEMHRQGAVNAATNEAEKGGRHGNGRVPS